MNNPSIRRQTLAFILIPLSVSLVLGTLFAFLMAHSLASNIHDRVLLNSASAVEARLRWGQTAGNVEILPSAQAVISRNATTKTYVQVLRLDGKRLAGDAAISAPGELSSRKRFSFRDSKLRDDQVRVVLLRATNPGNEHETVLIQVAETLEERDCLAWILALSITVPQVLFAALAAAAVWFGIDRALYSLKKLQQAIGERHKDDLAALVFVEVPAEVRPLVESINDLLQRLRAESETQRRFVANAAHQLRIPLVNLSSHTSQSKLDMFDSEARYALQQIANGVSSMRHLVDRLISMAKAEPILECDLPHQRVDLNFVASDSAAGFVQQAVAKRIDLTFLSAGYPAYVSGNRDALLDLADNLIENAILYTQRGGAITVRVSNGNGVRLTVEDNGPGIPQDQRQKIFEPFYRVATTDTPGSGLGLAVVREIAAAHNAKISLLDSVYHKGTVIDVAFEAA